MKLLARVPHLMEKGYHFSTEISDRICTHMNEDHASAVVLYAQAFGDQPQATEAQMLAIDANGMDLTAKVNDEYDPPYYYEPNLKISARIALSSTILPASGES